MTTSSHPDVNLLGYLVEGDRMRQEKVTRLLAMMTAREQKLVREVAVHAYVLGLMAGRAGDRQPPKDSETLHRTLFGCLSMPDINPTVARLGRRADLKHAKDVHND